jgi:hypothetical protein
VQGRKHYSRPLAISVSQETHVGKAKASHHLQVSYVRQKVPRSEMGRGVIAFERCEMMNVKLKEFEFMPREVVTGDESIAVLS